MKMSSFCQVINGQKVRKIINVTIFYSKKIIKFVIDSINYKKKK